MVTRLVLPIALTLVSAAAAQTTVTRSQLVRGATAEVSVSAQPALAEAAASAALAAIASAPEQSAGGCCDLALEAVRAAGASAAKVSFGGAEAAGAAPPGAPGWLTTLGFGTPGYRLAMLPLASAGVGRSAAADDPVKVCVVAATATEAERLAGEVRRLGRRAGRALIEGVPGARLFLEDARFTALPFGPDLAGWTTEGGRYDGGAIWSARAGTLTGRTGPDGEGGLIYTAREYTSYVLELDCRIDYPFDSGVFVHMVPRDRGLKGAQVTLDWRDGGEIAGIYSDGWLQHNEAAREVFRRDAWNHVEVRVSGFEMRVEVWLNGEKVTDYQLPSDAQGFASAGKIGLQVHGAKPGDHQARFRNVRIRELPVFEVREEQDSDWEELIGDADLSGWEMHGAQEGYRVEDGLLHLPARGGGHLASSQDYRDFRLRLDFKIARLANSGLFLRAARDGSNPAFSGCELQILDDFNWETATGSELKPWQFTGSLYGAVAPGTKALHPIGEWNTIEVLYRGSRLAAALNGRLLLDVDTHRLEPESGPAFEQRATEGFIGLQVHSPAGAEDGASVVFRGARVQRL